MIDIRTLRLLRYIHQKGGEIVGFREAAKELHMGHHTLKTAIKDLMYLGLVQKKTGPNNVMIIRTTKKGREAAQKLQEFLDIIEKYNS